MIQQTSQLSLIDTIKKGKIGKRQSQVIDLFVGEGYCFLNNRQIAEILNLPINSITPRVNELVKAGRLVEHKKMRDNVTNRLVIYWRLA